MPKILIVEDEPDFQQILKTAFEGQQYQVLLATDCKQGYLVAETNHPDLILLDIMLPGGMNGFDLLEQLKAHNRLQHIPVIILSNLDSENRVATEIGAMAYLVKAETSIEQVVAKVAEVLSASNPAPQG